MKYVIPKQGGKIRMPDTMGFIPSEGMAVELKGGLGKYLRRRINDGSLILYNEKPTAKTEKLIESKEIDQSNNKVKQNKNRER